MSRFRKLSQTLWHCQYHIVFVPKYRLRILTGDVASEVNNCIRTFVEQQKAEIVELNIQIDHVHLLTMVPPKVSISNFVGTIKGRTAIRVFNKFRHLKHKPWYGWHLSRENNIPCLFFLSIKFKKILLLLKFYCQGRCHQLTTVDHSDIRGLVTAWIGFVVELPLSIVWSFSDKYLFP